MIDPISRRVASMRQKIQFFCTDLLQSYSCFMKAYPSETIEAFLDRHVPAFTFFDGVPQLDRFHHCTNCASGSIAMAFMRRGNP